MGHKGGHCPWSLQPRQGRRECFISWAGSHLCPGRTFPREHAVSHTVMTDGTDAEAYLGSCRSPSAEAALQEKSHGR